MSINKYTFFSPNGNDFPVTANSDGKLYMMLTGLNYKDLRLKHWSAPLNTALNRVYVNTSLVIGGRYFELKDHSITLSPAVTNYIHAVIDLSNTAEPVTITVEQSNNTNSADINNTSGVLKVCFETIVTSGSGITSVTQTKQVYRFEQLTRPSDTDGWLDLGNFTSIKREGNTVTVKVVNAIRTTVGDITLGTIPPEHRPSASVMAIATSWSGTTTNDRHVQLNAGGSNAGGQTILSAAANQQYTFQYKYEI